MEQLRHRLTNVSPEGQNDDDGDRRGLRYLRCVGFSVLPVREDDEDQQWTLWMPFASGSRAVASGVPRKNRTSGIYHLPELNPDVGRAGRRESVAGARCRCGFDDAWPWGWRNIRGWQWMLCPIWVVCERAWF